MARAALRLGVRDVAELAGIAPATLTRYENERGGMQADTRDKLQNALEARGVTFEGDDGHGPGVRHAKPSDDGSAPHGK